VIVSQPQQEIQMTLQITVPARIFSEEKKLDNSASKHKKLLKKLAILVLF
jgi:hypothetical protein